MKQFLFLKAFLIYGFTTLFAQTIVDYRSWQSPVRDQGQRGTCTAFAIAALLESRPGFPTDVSEHHIYAMAKLKYYLSMPKTYDEGGSLAFYQELLKNQGVLPEFKFPYIASSPVWKEDYTTREKMEQDIKTSFLDLLQLNRYSYKASSVYVSDEEAQNVEKIKELLDKGGKSIAVSYVLNGSYWSRHTGQADKKISPWDFLSVKKDGKVLSEVQRTFSFNNWIDMYKKDQIELIFNDPSYKINEGHAVTIVGYDKDGFIIKNSWGTGWGDKGYGWVSFDYHRLFAREYLYITDYYVHGWDDQNVVYQPQEIELKSLPHFYTNYFSGKKSTCTSVSIVYTGDNPPPRFKSVTYNIYDSNNVLLETQYGNTHGIFDGFLSGYETYIACSPFPFTRNVDKIVATLELNNGQKIVNTYYGIEPVNRQHGRR